jgi:hypothetical protein
MELWLMSSEALSRVWVSFDLVARERDGITFDPDYVTRALGIEPTQQNRSGDPIHDGQGRWTFTRWRISEGPLETVTITGMLDQVISRLSTAGQKLNTVCDEIGVEPILTCTVEPQSAETPDVTFPRPVVQWAANNNVALAVDIMLWRRDNEDDG